MRSLGLPISQVSHSGPPVVPLLSIILKTGLPLFPHHSIDKFTHHLLFYTYSDPQLHSFLPCSLSLYFGFFGGLFMIAPCYKHFSPPFHIILYCFPIPLIPCLPPYSPIFVFLTHFQMLFSVQFNYDLCVHVNVSLLVLNIENMTDFLGCNELLGQGE
jgi:hypothetical protein